MDLERTISQLESGEASNDVLNDFYLTYETSYQLPGLNTESRQRLWNSVFDLTKVEDMRERCLKVIRILSRDVTNLDDILRRDYIESLFSYSMLKTNSEIDVSMKLNVDVIAEALQCLANLFYNSGKARIICTDMNIVEAILRHFETQQILKLHRTIRYFDMKLLFLITALVPTTRLRLVDELEGTEYLMEALDFVLQDGGGLIVTDSSNSTLSKIKYVPTLDKDGELLACEILKVLFNVTTVTSKKECLDYGKLITIIRALLSSDTTFKSEMCRHAVNLLLNVPLQFDELLAPLDENDQRDMEVWDTIVSFVEFTLQTENDATLLWEKVAPSLTLLTTVTRSFKFLRRHLKKRILPPIKNVSVRPEEGSGIRGRLCKLLTSPNTKLRDLVGDFLLSLCKENVSRMVKYTGYGNAAGMFANRGLMGEALRNSKEKDYSSDSEDSSTEEYSANKHQINLVTGCVEPPRVNPMEGMTDEQKEYEAVRLVNTIDQLSREGVFQPCRIGDDGKPTPIEHVLQLQEQLSKQQISRGDE